MPAGHKNFCFPLYYFRTNFLRYLATYQRAITLDCCVYIAVSSTSVRTSEGTQLDSIMNISELKCLAILTSPQYFVLF
jgi:hypothetical protein